MARPPIRPLGYGRFWKLRKMKCFPEVRAKLVAGVSTVKIARWVQDDCGERNDIKLGSLAAELSALRRSLGSMELVQAMHPGVFDDAVDKLGNGLNELEELAEIYGVQKTRIMDMHEMEKKLKVPHRGTGNEVRIAAELLRTSHQIKADLGALNHMDRVEPGPADLYDVRGRYGEQVASVIGDPERRMRVLAAVDKLLSKATPEAEPVEAKASGE